MSKDNFEFKQNNEFFSSSQKISDSMSLTSPVLNFNKFNKENY